MRILVADDHAVVREGVKALLMSRSGWTVCGEAATGAETLAKARALQPDIVVLDVGMPEGNGLDVARQLRDECPACRVLVLTLHDSEHILREALAAGARGVVLKSDVASDLVAAVEALGRSRAFFSSSVSEVILHDYAGRAGAEVREGALTPREEQVLRLLAEGATSRQAAAQLGVSVKTVDTHRGHLMTKLGLHSVAELVRYAVRNGVIQA